MPCLGLDLQAAQKAKDEAEARKTLQEAQQGKQIQAIKLWFYSQSFQGAVALALQAEQEKTKAEGLAEAVNPGVSL